MWGQRLSRVAWLGLMGFPAACGELASEGEPGSTGSGGEIDRPSVGGAAALGGMADGSNAGGSTGTIAGGSPGEGGTGATGAGGSGQVSMGGSQGVGGALPSCNGAPCPKCPPAWYRPTGSNSETCIYGGCQAGEVEVERGSSAAASVCAPDPTFTVLDTHGPGYPEALIAQGGEVHAFVRYTKGESEIRSYSNGKHQKTRACTVPYAGYSSGVMIGAAGQIYRTGSAMNSDVPGLSVSDDCATWDSLPLRPETASVLLAANSTHLFVAEGLPAGDATPSGNTLLRRIDAHGVAAGPERTVGFAVWNLSPDEQGGVWLNFENSGYRGMSHLDSLDSDLESVINIFPAAIASSPAGKGYAAEYYEGAFVVELSNDAEILNKWSLEMEGFMLHPTLIAAIGEDTVVVAGQAVAPEYPPYPSSRGDIFVAIIKTDVGVVDLKHLSNPELDYPLHLAATPSGEAYLAGEINVTGSSSFYVRQVY
jgi:hypothetical protein